MAGTTARTPWRLRVGWTIGVLAVVSLVPLGLLAWSSIRLSSDAVRGQAEKRVESTAQAGAVAIEQRLDGLMTVVESYAKRPALIEALAAPDGSGTSASFHLAQLIEAVPDIGLAFLADPDGILLDIIPSTPTIIGDDFSYRDWYRGVTESGHVYLSEVYETRAAGGGLVVAAAAPIRSGPDADDRVIGILVAGYQLDTLQRFVDQFATAQGVLLTVTDQRGALVARPGSAPKAVTSLTEDAAVRSALAGRATIDEQGDGDRKVLSATVPVPSVGWTLTAAVRSSTALAEADDVRRAVLALSLVLALVLAGGLALMGISLRRRARAEAELEESERFLDSVIENLPTMVFVKDADELRFVRFNRAGEELVGVDRDDMIGRNDFDLFPQEQAEFFVSKDREVLSQRRLVDIPEERVQTRLGGERILHTRKIPILDEQGSAKYLLGIAEDITAQHASRLAIEKARLDAERANNAKTMFVSRMSHELRTPLNAILGFAQLLELQGDSPEQRDNATHIIRAGRHLLELINEILDLSTIETGRLAVSLEAVRLEDVVTEVTNLLRSVADRRRISIEVHGVSDGFHVRADRQRLRQVLLNLVGNAVKYNHDGGHVWISCAEAGHRVRIEVADDGPGISADRRELLFAPFERLGAELSDVEGTGLGLALSAGLVEVMGGAIGLDPSTEGSTFWIEFDQVDPPVATLPTEDERLTEPGAVHDANAPRSVLYVEDNLANVKLVERILAHRPNVTLHIATRGAGVVDMAATNGVDLVLLDLNLPDMSGRTVLHHLRSDPRTRDVPVVVVSADATEHQIKLLLSTGADDYLTKPFDVRRFLDVVNRAWRDEGRDGGEPAPEGPAETPAETAPATPPIAELDADVLGDLVDVIGEDGLADLVATFCEEATGLVEELRQAASSADSDTVRRIAHNLKGSAGIVGATSLVAVLAALEQLAIMGELDGAGQRLVERVGRELDNVVAALANR